MTTRKQTNRPRQPKMPVRRGRAWFERNVAGRKAQRAKPPGTQARAAALGGPQPVFALTPA
jgi:hypothetical protein